VAKPEWGVKRGCLKCGTKFYDFSREPIVCPNCKSSFRAEDFARPKRGARPESKIEAAPAVVKKRAKLAEPEEAEAGVADDDLDVDIDDEEVDDVDLADDDAADAEDAGDDDAGEERALAGDAGVADGSDDPDEEDDGADDVLEAEDEDEDLESQLTGEIDADFRKEDVG